LSFIGTNHFRLYKFSRFRRDKEIPQVPQTWFRTLVLESHKRLHSFPSESFRQCPEDNPPVLLVTTRIKVAPMSSNDADASEAVNLINVVIHQQQARQQRTAAGASQADSADNLVGT
jgi:hypothetical protein